MMDRLFETITKHKLTVLLTFMVVTILSVAMKPFVSVNYNLLDYLPDAAPSTIALNEMDEEYEGGVPNARIMVEDISITEAASLKKELEDIQGIEGVTWLDDVVDIEVPIEMADKRTVEDYYKDGNALFTVTVDDDETIEALNTARSILEKEAGKGHVFMSGAAVNTAASTESTNKEVNKIILIVIPICFIILFLTTSSWFEPVLFMSTIGIAILINNGTNLLMGEISFVTNAAGSILQLAVSMDYSIFLLHRFADFRNEGLDVEEAMTEALKKSVGSIASSGLTTVIGFAALILMKFKIGPDMGWVMAKAIVISMITVLMLLPVLSIYCYKLIDKTQHRPLMPPFEKFSHFVQKIKMPVLLVAALLAIPAFLASEKNDFEYGSSEIFGPGTEPYEERVKVEEAFGRSNQFVLMVPKGDFAKEKQLSDSLREIPQISNILSYVDVAGPEVPPEYLDETTLKQLISDKYSRMVLSVETDYESEEAFGIVEEIRDISHQYYGDDYLLAGESVNTYDMKEVVTHDMEIVNTIAIAAVFIVIALSLKSIAMPVLLVLTIEFSVWLNLAFPYFQNHKLFYIAYLIISTVQLGATVDYAILIGSRYLEERQVHAKKIGLIETMKHTTLSVLTSSSILALSGFFLGALTTNGVLSQLGTLVSRGAVLSTVSVLFILPALLYVFDGLIAKTTKDSQFIKEESTGEFAEGMN